jgi:hypothetical protein
MHALLVGMHALLVGMHALLVGAVPVSRRRDAHVGCDREGARGAVVSGEVPADAGGAGAAGASEGKGAKADEVSPCRP